MTVVPELRDELRRAAVRQAQFAATGLGSRPEPGLASPISRRARWRAWLRRGGLPLVVALVLGGGAVAAATGLVISQATKDRSTALTREPGPTPERPGRFAQLGDEMVRQAREIQAGLPYPPGLRDTYDWSKYSAAATLGTGGETRREMALMIEFRAQCLWLVAWRQARQRGDRRTAADAMQIVREAQRWPATRGLGANGWAWQLEKQLRARNLRAVDEMVAVNCNAVAGLPAPSPLRHP